MAEKSITFREKTAARQISLIREAPMPGDKSAAWSAPMHGQPR